MNGKRTAHMVLAALVFLFSSFSAAEAFNIFSYQPMPEALEALELLGHLLSPLRNVPESVGRHFAFKPGDRRVDAFHVEAFAQFLEPGRVVGQACGDFVVHDPSLSSDRQHGDSDIVQNRGRKQESVASIEYAPVPGEQPARVLYAGVPL